MDQEIICAPQNPEKGYEQGYAFNLSQNTVVEFNVTPDTQGPEEVINELKSDYEGSASGYLAEVTSSTSNYSKYEFEAFVDAGPSLSLSTGGLTLSTNRIQLKGQLDLASNKLEILVKGKSEKILHMSCLRRK